MGRTLARSAAVVSAVRRGEPAREATCDVTNELTGGGVLGVAGRPAHGCFSAGYHDKAVVL